MLKSLHLKNFTVFPDANLAFGRHLNVIIGENGTGKTHLLKAIYAGIAASANAYFEQQKSAQEPSSKQRVDLESKLSGVFRADQLLNLIHRSKSECNGSPNAQNELRLDFKFDVQALDFKFKLRAASILLPKIDREGLYPSIIPEWETAGPNACVETRPVFLPTRELLSIAPGFVSLYETTYLPFEETWRDTAILLGAPLAKGEREPRIATLLKPLEAAMGGRLIREESGRFYLQRTETDRIEMHLLAEGFRKLGMIARLIATGALIDKGYLFWDEPESNMNPRLVKTVARTILQLASSGIQVFIATHSLFLLRELHILQKQLFKHLDSRCFGLQTSEDGVQVKQGPTMDNVGEFAALDEDLQQSERYIDTEMGLIAPELASIPANR